MNILKITYVTIVALITGMILYAAYYKINNGPAIEVSINLETEGVNDTNSPDREIHYIKSVDYKFNKKAGIYTDNAIVDTDAVDPMDKTLTTTTA